MTARPGYYTLEEAADGLGVQKPSLYYYIRMFNLKTQKFPLDKHKYLPAEDFERVKGLKDAAKGSSTSAAH